MPIAGYRSTEHGCAETRTTVVRREPAAPSTRSCEAFNAEAVHAAATETGLGTALGDSGGWVIASVGPAVGAPVGGIEGAMVGLLLGPTEGVPEQAPRPRASVQARNGAAARVRALPRRTAMHPEAYRRDARHPSTGVAAGS